MILIGSRYYGRPVLTVPTGEATSGQAVFRPPPGAASSFFYYTVVDGDRLDNLAFRIYGNANLWWRLADANPELFYPEMLIPGSVLRIPMA